MCVIGYGERAIKKTEFMFGPASNSLHSPYAASMGGFAKQFISTLYKDLRAKDGLGTVAISAWVVKGAKIIE
jgi:hypothetical protein